MFQDGFGSRSVVFEPGSDAPVEVLAFQPRLIGTPGFGAAIGERVARLSRVRHTLYARVRRVERPSENGLLMYSDAVAGWRLSDVLDHVERDQWPIDVGVILALIRQLIPAVALFSRHQRDATIGTIGPERLLLTPHGRLIITEYVMAPGLETLQCSRERLWRGFRVAVPTAHSPHRFTPAADAVGIGVTALSLLLRRRLKEDEYLVSLGELVEGLTESHGGTTRPLSREFRAWLSRALQFDDRTAFASTHEAQTAFEEMLAKEGSYVTTSAQLEMFVSKYERVAGRPDASWPAPPAAIAAPAAAATRSTPVADVRPASTDAPARPLAGPAVEPQAVPAAEAAGELEQMTAVSMDSFPAERWRFAPIGGRRWLPYAFAAVVAVACLEAAALVSLTRETAVAATEGELAVQSRPLAARVTIDGEERGTTPFEATLSEGPHVLEVRVGRSEPRVIPVLIRAGARSELYVELQSVVTVGGLDVRTSPGKARVTVAGQFRGMSPLTLRDLPPGETEVVLQTGTRQVRQTIRIEPGITSQLVVPLDR